MAHTLLSRQKLLEDCSWEVSMALDLLGYQMNMIKWRQYQQEKRTRIVNGFLSVVPENFGPGKFSLQLTGSKQEGSSVWDGSDEDFMVIMDRYICVTASADVTDKPEKVLLLLDNKNAKPGYAFLQKTPMTCLERHSVTDNMLARCVTQDGYISSQCLNQLIYHTVRECEETVKSLAPVEANHEMKTHLFQKDETDYPKIVFKIKGYVWHTIDYVPAIACIHPEITNRWAHRERKYGWPPQDVVEKIRRMDVHIVPKGHKGGPDRDREFRICYTLGEIKLMKSLNETQLKLYVLMKSLLKTVIDKAFPDVLSSYVMKNVLFWVCETTPQDRFTNGLLLARLTQSLEYIRACIETDHLPNYFIPERNLLEGRLEGNKPGIISLLAEYEADSLLIVNGVPEIKRGLDIIRMDIVLAQAICLFRNVAENWLIEDRTTTVKTLVPGVLLLGMCIVYDYLAKTFIKWELLFQYRR